MRSKSRHPAIAWYAALVSLSAYGGAVGLATGGLDLGPELNHRLPFHSPVVGALALTALVGLPTTLLARVAARGDRRTRTAAAAVGAMLVGWIAVELAFIRELSPLQAFYVVVGVTFVVIGRRVDAGPGT
jgi:drug/metabolite transporter (DMT)-like permease